MTVPVLVNGRGPYPFVVDTAADRTVISRELAAALRLPSSNVVMLNDTGGADLAQTAKIDELTVGLRTLHDISAPLLSSANLGAMGMIGIDSLADQRVVMDLRHDRMSVEPSRHERFGSDMVVVRARSRYGQLVLVDAAVDGAPVAVILDSGAQNSVGNLALRDMFMRGARLKKPVGDVISVTGRTTPARFAYLPTVEIGSFTLHQVPMAFADLHTFAQFDMNGQPAMLLGMDMMRLFDRVAVDFGRKEVTFQLPLNTDNTFIRVADAR